MREKEGRPAAEAPQPGLWKEIAGCFLALEEQTQQMLGCPQEEWPERMEARSRLMTQIDGLNEQLARQGAAAGADPEAQAQARAAAGRLRELDAQLLARMKGARDRILAEIRSIEKSAGAKAARYYRPAAPASTFHDSI